MNHVLVQFCQHKRNENPQYIDMSCSNDVFCDTF